MTTKHVQVWFSGGSGVRLLTTQTEMNHKWSIFAFTFQSVLFGAVQSDARSFYQKDVNCWRTVILFLCVCGHLTSFIKEDLFVLYEIIQKNNHFKKIGIFCLIFFICNLLRRDSILQSERLFRLHREKVIDILQEHNLQVDIDIPDRDFLSPHTTWFYCATTFW